MQLCRYCGLLGHTQFYCRQKPRTPIKTHKLPNKVGRVGKKTAQAVAKWKKAQKPNHEGYYQCYICSKLVDYLTAEHVKSKARRPDLRADPDNFKPTCGPCNARKGSKNN